ncbi:calcitonin gene-related peptide type 1 receptor isoform X2 [Drosophila yakuba]|nr:calcitonin gene-related peptide type 1 receptor isoform X2 [Drosophila yakuba]
MSDQLGNPNATFSGSGSGSGSGSAIGGSNAAAIAESVAESGPDFDALRAACETRLNASGQLAGSEGPGAGVGAGAEAGTHCAGTFDGWLCWPDTAVGTSAYELCPEFITGFDPARYAHKECGLDGEWFKHPLTNKTWSNYTTCVNLDDLEWRHNVNLIYEVGYGTSLLAILLSLAILGYFKSLKCARITLHMNLFASFAANNSLWLVWYLLVMPNSELLHHSPLRCVALHITLHYFLLSNYSWMLCEGFYLHTVLVAAFISEKRLVKWLIAFGWGSPAIVIFVYSMARGLGGTPEDHRHCWMSQTNYDNILVVPVCISMFLNLLFLCNIVRVVLLKLNAPASIQGSCGPSRTILQAFRATLLLVPLLGLQYIVTPFRPAPGHPWENTYEIISAFTASFQGLCVATLFCFCNGEVIAQMKRKWRMMCFSNRPRTNSYTATQVSFVRCGPPLPGEEKV